MLTYLMVIFFICYLTARQPILHHYQGGSLTDSMLLTKFFHFLMQRLVIMVFLKLEMDGIQTCRHTDRLTHRKTDEHKTIKIWKNNTVCCQCCSARYRVSVLSRRCEGFVLKGSLLAGHIR